MFSVFIHTCTQKLNVDDVQAYSLLLKQEKTAVFCNYSFTAVMVQEFELDNDKCSFKLKV